MLASRRRVRLGIRRDMVLGASAVSIYSVPEAALRLLCDGDKAEREGHRALQPSKLHG